MRTWSAKVAEEQGYYMLAATIRKRRRARVVDSEVARDSGGHG